MKLKANRSVVVIFFVFIIVILVNLAWWFFYLETEKSLESQLSHRLSSLAMLGASGIKPDLINSLTDGYLSAYDSTLEILENIKNADSLSEVFIVSANYEYLATTLIELDSTYYLTALNGEYIDSAFSLIYDFHPVVTGGYRVGDVVLKSVFVPLPDTTGLVMAVLGIEADVDYTDVLVELQNNLYLSTLVSLAAGVIFGLFFFIVQRKMATVEKSLFLSQSQANLGRMVAVVSHEIKNPLMIVRASAERIIKTLGKSQEADFIIEETDRLNNILNNYLDFASGKIALKTEKVNLNDLIEKIGDKFIPRLAKDGINLTYWQVEKDLYTNADANALRQVIINLILNGAEAVKDCDDGKVDIICRKVSNRAFIEVMDNGSGISAKDMKSIFEPFYTTKTTGSGLGLYHSRRLIEEMGGEIMVKTTDDDRTDFMILFKIADKDN